MTDREKLAHLMQLNEVVRRCLINDQDRCRRIMRIFDRIPWLFRKVFKGKAYRKAKRIADRAVRRVEVCLLTMAGAAMAVSTLSHKIEMDMYGGTNINPGAGDPLLN
jgi:hypothetical protein